MLPRLGSGIPLGALQATSLGLVGSGPCRSQRHLRASLHQRPQLLKRIRIPHNVVQTLHITQVDHRSERQPTEIRTSFRDVIELPETCDSSDGKI